MKYSPPASVRRAWTVSVILLSLAAASYVISLTDVPLHLGFELLCMGCVCAAVYILVRFVYTRVTYILRPRNDSAPALDSSSSYKTDLCVVKTQGRREGIAECVLSLDDLVRIDEFTDGYTSRLRAEIKGVKFYFYTVSMFPKRRLALIFDDGHDDLCIVIETDEDFELALRRLADANKTNI